MLNHTTLSLVLQRWSVACILLLASISFPQTISAAKPQRIVSINLCTDQLLLMLVAPERIASISSLALDPHSSYMAEAASGHQINHGKTEELLPLKPDLVLASGFAARPAVKLMRHLGYKVEVLPMTTDIAGIRKNIRQLALLVGEESRGEQLIQQMDKKITAVTRRLSNSGPKAIFYQPRGYTSGSNTLQDEVMRLAGWHNVATDIGVSGYSSIGLEELLMAQPEQIFTSSYAPGTSSMAQRQLQHPVIRRLTRERPMVEVSYRLWICDGPMIADAVEALASAHQ
ncbi:MAG: ABC transporter substrate-binding protein [Gammaproteobacteria bacterium]|nr:ABC transporter substrate-binding protein [Gammaproteobacteria bacterium]